MVGWQVVVDVGCGTGILSIFCAYAGARKAGFYLCSFSKSRIHTPGHDKVDGENTSRVNLLLYKLFHVRVLPASATLSTPFIVSGMSLHLLFCKEVQCQQWTSCWLEDADAVKVDHIQEFVRSFVSYVGAPNTDQPIG